VAYKVTTGAVEEEDASMVAKRALVLGGGGIAGIAWHLGVLTALAEAGVDTPEADYIVGTSAGATVAAQMASGQPLDDWYQRQVDPAKQNVEFRAPGLSIEELFTTMLQIMEEVADPAERRRRIGAMALAADTVSEGERRAVVEGRLPIDGWPERRIATVAVDATSGDRHVFDSGSEVDLVDAVAASSAVPGIWPPVTIGGARYIDGGIYSLCNADLAAGYQRVLILAPMVDDALAEERARIESTGVTFLIQPDTDAVAAFSADPLDPAVRAPSARAGYAQGQSAAPAVAEFWGDPGSDPE
jgi:NTE family protein